MSKAPLILTLALLLAALHFSHNASAASTTEAVAFSQNATQLLYLSAENGKPVVRFINLSSGQQHSMTTLDIDPRRQLLMGFTPDGFKLAVLAADGLSIAHNQTGKILRTLPVPHLPVPVTRYMPEPAITNASGTQQLFHRQLSPGKALLQVIHTGNGKQLASIQLSGTLQAIGMSPDGRLLAAQLRTANSNQQELQVHDIYQHKLLHQLTVPASSKPFAQPLQFDRSNRYLVQLPLITDLHSGQTSKLSGSSGMAVFTANGSQLVFEQQGRLFRYNLQTRQQQAVLTNLSGNCRTVAHDSNQNGSQLVFAQHCSDGVHFTLLNGTTAQFIRIIPLKKP